MLRINSIQCAALSKEGRKCTLVPFSSHDVSLSNPPHAYVIHQSARGSLLIHLCKFALQRCTMAKKFRCVRMCISVCVLDSSDSRSGEARVTKVDKVSVCSRLTFCTLFRFDTSIVKGIKSIVTCRNEVDRISRSQNCQLWQLPWHS